MGIGHSARLFCSSSKILRSHVPSRRSSDLNANNITLLPCTLDHLGGLGSFFHHLLFGSFPFRFLPSPLGPRPTTSPIPPLFCLSARLPYAALPPLSGTLASGALKPRTLTVLAPLRLPPNGPFKASPLHFPGPLCSLGCGAHVRHARSPPPSWSSF